MFDFILFWNIFSENVHLIKQKIIQNQLICNSKILFLKKS